jgi:hypothetical protein
VSWDAGNSNVRSATIELSKIGSRAHGGARFDEQDEFAAALPNGSRGFDLPYGFGGEVTARFNVTLDNGDRHNVKATRTIRDECYVGPAVKDPPAEEENRQPPYPPPQDSGSPPADPYPPRVRWAQRFFESNRVGWIAARLTGGSHSGVAELNHRWRGIVKYRTNLTTMRE